MEKIMIKDIFILSPVRRVGGSGTEIAHLCDLFLMHGITPHLVCGVFGDDVAMRWVTGRGCHLVNWELMSACRWVALKDQVVLAHGNPNFLAELPRIRAAKPAKIIYISPMWEPSANELVAINDGLIDRVVHVSAAQWEHHYKIYASKGMKMIPTTNYQPFINLNSTLQRLEFINRPNHDYFGIGRVSRPHHEKFNADLWAMMRAIETPRPKRIFINSWVDEVAKKCGPIPSDLDVATYAPYEVEIGDFMYDIDMIVQRSDAGEAFGRYVLEAWACGVPCVLEKGKNAFAEMGEPGVHFMWGETSSNQANVASWLVRHHYSMARAARLHLEATYGNPEYCWTFWRSILS